jgi:putative flippase GtrA
VSGFGLLFSVHWVFRRANTGGNSAWRPSPVAIGVVGLLITQLILWLTIEKWPGIPELSRLGAAGITFVFNFTVRKLVLFRRVVH